MIVPDVNLLLCAHVNGFAAHDQARRWWEGALSGTERVGLAPVVVTGFVRLITSPRVLDTPLGVGAATGIVRSWLDRTQVEVLHSNKNHVQVTLQLLDDVGAAGNLTTDALIAAHALEVGARVATNDTDFARFEGVQVVNPLKSPA